MKIIFLDIDGVLNGYRFIPWFCRYILHLKSKWFHRIPLLQLCSVDETKVYRLAKIIKKTNAKVVLSSTWRFDYWTVPYLEKRKEDKKLDDLLQKYHIEVIGITPSLDCGHIRGDEISLWLQNNIYRYKITNFIILDDESDMGALSDRLVQTVNATRKVSWKTTGLQKRHVKKAIQMLNKTT